jgi:hypothetical protein
LPEAALSNTIENCVPQWLSGILNALLSLCTGYLGGCERTTLQEVV